MQAQNFCRDACRHLEEGVRRIATCLDLIDEPTLWHDHSVQLVSIGNLILHLRGNVSQYILRGLGGRDFVRRREAEFTARPGQSKAQLLGLLSDTITEASGVIDGLADRELDFDYTIQGFTLSGAGVVLHVVEHFSYHVGQITFATKLSTGKSTNYYAGRDLNRE
jgi:uncharacterized damage-inducible protein DinB